MMISSIASARVSLAYCPRTPEPPRREPHSSLEQVHRLGSPQNGNPRLRTLREYPENPAVIIGDDEIGAFLGHANVVDLWRQNQDG